MSVPARARIRAAAAVAGLAGGDAVSFPAMYHRVLALPQRRRLLWTQSLELDEHRVNKFSLPFVMSAPAAIAMFGPTDDAEQLAFTAQLLLGVGDDPSVDELFDAWRDLAGGQADEMWGSIADRSALRNLASGLRAPHTGNDNPHHYDDSSVVRAVAVGIAWHRDPGAGALIARRLASITNAGDGVDGAAAMAAAVAAGIGGADTHEALELARREIAADSWTARRLQIAEDALAAAGGAFAAVPLWTDEITSQEYNFGNATPETLPLALVIAGNVGSIAEGLGVAALLPKHADTLLAMVGALLGATTGEELPDTWRERLRATRGVCVPSTSDALLEELTTRLLERGASR